MKAIPFVRFYVFFKGAVMEIITYFGVLNNTLEKK